MNCIEHGDIVATCWTVGVVGCAWAFAWMFK